MTLPAVKLCLESRGVAASASGKLRPSREKGRKMRNRAVSKTCITFLSNSTTRSFLYTFTGNTFLLKKKKKLSPRWSVYRSKLLCQIIRDGTLCQITRGGIKFFAVLRAPPLIDVPRETWLSRIFLCKLAPLSPRRENEGHFTDFSRRYRGLRGGMSAGIKPDRAPPCRMFAESVFLAD